MSIGAADSATAKTIAIAPWYRSLHRDQWYALVAANLGWCFDGYQTYALILTVTPVLRQLLPSAQYRSIPFYAGLTIAVTLLGWGLGGMVGGVISDYIGRKRMLIYAILASGLLTGCTALAWSWTSFVALRFLVGLALGSEWGTGTAMVAEMWPDQHRGKGAALMQCGLGIGFFIASAVWLVISGFGPSAWRWIYVIGVFPIVFAWWIQRRLSEPAKWAEVDRRRREAAAARKAGKHLDQQSAQLARFTLWDLLTDSRIRPRLITALLMSASTTLAWWGISTWVPPYVASLAVKQGLGAEQWASFAGMAYNFGGIAGYIAFGFCADAWGRKPVTITWFALAFLFTPILFLWTHDLHLILIVCGINAFFSLGQYTWCSTWLPEAFPTRIRGTAVSVCFNAPRLIAFVAPLVAGTLITHFGNYGKSALFVSLIYFLGISAAPFFPETRGKPLPE